MNKTMLTNYVKAFFALEKKSCCGSASKIYPPSCYFWLTRPGKTTLHMYSSFMDSCIRYALTYGQHMQSLVVIVIHCCNCLQHLVFDIMSVQLC